MRRFILAAIFGVSVGGAVFFGVAHGLGDTASPDAAPSGFLNTPPPAPTTVPRLPDVVDVTAGNLDQGALIGFDRAASRVLTGLTENPSQGRSRWYVPTKDTKIQVTLKVQPTPPPGTAYVGPPPGVAFYEVVAEPVCIDLDKMPLPFGHGGLPRYKCPPGQASVAYVDARTGQVWGGS